MEKTRRTQPLIVKGARQIGKTFSIEAFAKENYEYVVSINFVLQPKCRSIFDDGYEVDSILLFATAVESTVVANIDISFQTGT